MANRILIWAGAVTCFLCLVTAFFNPINLMFAIMVGALTRQLYIDR